MKSLNTRRLQASFGCSVLCVVLLECLVLSDSRGILVVLGISGLSVYSLNAGITRGKDPMTTLLFSLLLMIILLFWIMIQIMCTGLSLNRTKHCEKHIDMVLGTSSPGSSFLKYLEKSILLNRLIFLITGIVLVLTIMDLITQLRSGGLL